MKPGYKQFKYLFTAELGQLLIKAGISCQVSATWKRSEESAKTDPVNFTNGAANFDQTLSLPVKMYLNEATQLYEEKKSQFTFTLHSSKGEKSAGTVKIDLSKLLNEKLTELQQAYVLEKCPDPNATIRIKLQAELLGEQDMEKQKMSDNESLNTSISSYKIEELPEQSIYSGGQCEQKPKAESNPSQTPGIPPKRQQQLLKKISELQKDKSRLVSQNRQLRQTLVILEKQSVSNRLTQRKLSQDIQLARHKSERSYQNLIQTFQELI